MNLDIMKNLKFCKAKLLVIYTFSFFAMASRMATAREQVLAMPELMESILLQLPFQELLINAQCVSQTWNAIISSSPLLQQKLFFQPWASNVSRPYEFNPLLRERFWRYFPDRSEELGEFLFCCLPGPIDWNRNHYFGDCADCKDYENVDASHAVHAEEMTRKKQDAYARKEASWRRMLPIQPANKIFEVTSKLRHYLGTTISLGEVEFKDGVRMGTLYDYSQMTVVDPSASFWVDWHHPWPGEDNSNGRGKVTMSVWRTTQPVAIESDSEDGYSAMEDLKWQTGRDICSRLYRSLGYKNLDIKFKVVSNEEHEHANERLTEWIMAKSSWTPRLGN